MYLIELDETNRLSLISSFYLKPFQSYSQKTIFVNRSKGHNSHTVCGIIAKPYVSCRVWWEEHFSHILFASISYGFCQRLIRKFKSPPFWKWLTVKKNQPRIYNQRHEIYLETEFHRNLTTLNESTNFASKTRNKGHNSQAMFRILFHRQSASDIIHTSEFWYTLRFPSSSANKGLRCLGR